MVLALDELQLLSSFNITISEQDEGIPLSKIVHILTLFISDKLLPTSIEVAGLLYVKTAGCGACKVSAACFARRS